MNSHRDSLRFYKRHLPGVDWAILTPGLQSYSSTRYKCVDVVLLIVIILQRRDDSYQRINGAGCLQSFVFMSGGLVGVALDFILGLPHSSSGTCGYCLCL